MALHISCGNGHQVLVPDCAPECAALPGVHIAGCPGADLDSLLNCPPGGGCCEEDHDHGHAARSCATDHAAAGHECPNPEPGNCRIYHGTEPEAGPCPVSVHGKELEDCTHDECPGGHHGLGVTDCGVCRPITITFYSPPGAPANIGLVN